MTRMNFTRVVEKTRGLLHPFLTIRETIINYRYNELQYVEYTYSVYKECFIQTRERERERNRDKDRDRLIDRDRKKEGGKNQKKG